MYYLNGRIDYRGLSPKDVNTELYRRCTQLHKQGFHTKYVKNFANKNKPHFCKQKVGRQGGKKFNWGLQRAGLRSGCNWRKIIRDYELGKG